MKSRIHIRTIAIGFVAALLGVAVHYAFLTRLLAGNWSGFEKINDIPDMLVFATATATAAVVLLYVREKFARVMLGAGLALSGITLIIIITADRFLAVHPEGSVGGWYTAADIVAVFALVLMAMGLARLVVATFKST